jgi:hypothetical protein
MVMASSKSGCLPFDPHQIDLPSIPALVAFYHACLGFPVKDTWLDAIKAGNCDTLLDSPIQTWLVAAPILMKHFLDI